MTIVDALIYLLAASAGLWLLVHIADWLATLIAESPFGQAAVMAMHPRPPTVHA